MLARSIVIAFSLSFSYLRARVLLWFSMMQWNENASASPSMQILWETRHCPQKSYHEEKSIVGVNQPVQVMALAYWVPNSPLKTHGHEFNGIRFLACICHVLQLVITDTFTQSAPLGDRNGTMLEVAVACNISEVIQITKSHCPVHVVARWFSQENSIAWSLQRLVILSTLDLTDFKDAERRKVAKAISAENFTKMKMLSRLAHPFTKCVRFFEGNRASISYVQPVWLI
jgi:hypothetical protein